MIILGKEDMAKAIKMNGQIMAEAYAAMMKKDLAAYKYTPADLKPAEEICGPRYRWKRDGDGTVYGEVRSGPPLLRWWFNPEKGTVGEPVTPVRGEEEWRERVQAEAFYAFVEQEFAGIKRPFTEGSEWIPCPWGEGYDRITYTPEGEYSFNVHGNAWAITVEKYEVAYVLKKYKGVTVNWRSWNF